MMSGNYGFMGGFMWIFWILVIVGLVFLIKWIVQSNRLGESRISDSSLEILKKRYARGEIDKQEFEHKKKDLLEWDKLEDIKNKHGRRWLVWERVKKKFEGRNESCAGPHLREEVSSNIGIVTWQIR